VISASMFPSVIPSPVSLRPAIRDTFHFAFIFDPDLDGSKRPPLFVVSGVRVLAVWGLAAIVSGLAGVWSSWSRRASSAEQRGS
jgi:hypothetical protein